MTEIIENHESEKVRNRRVHFKPDIKMESTDTTSLTIVQINDTHGYFDIHQEMFWQGDHTV